VTYQALVITVSTRTAAGIWTDTSGPILVSGLSALGIEVAGPVVVADGDPVGVALRSGIDSGYDLIVTTGGTGLSPTDHTPEQTRPLLDREIPGIPEAIRAQGLGGGMANAVLSRGLAGLARTTLIINVPGSAGGARDAIAAVAPTLLHALDQIAGHQH
jgi:molybdenum cofactor synthesis domain-containing protein